MDPSNISYLDIAEHPEMIQVESCRNQNTIISTRGLTKIFGKFCAVDNLSFDVLSN